MSKLIEKIVMWFLVRRWVKKIQADPTDPEVLEMAARTGRIRDLRNL